MFRGAVRADMARILDIYARAREFMAKNGNPTQWGDNYPSPELLEEDIDTNRLFVYMVNGRMQAVFAFILGEDPTYKVIEDGHWLNDTLPYGTLHRLASAGESKGIGKAVVEWCLEHCESLRADTHADNKVMQHLLESEGFTRCGITLLSAWMSARRLSQCSRHHSTTALPTPLLSPAEASRCKVP